MNFHFAIYFFVKSEKVIPLKGMSEFDGRPVQNQKKYILLMSNVYLQLLYYKLGIWSEKIYKTL